MLRQARSHTEQMSGPCRTVRQVQREEGILCAWQHRQGEVCHGRKSVLLAHETVRSESNGPTQDRCMGGFEETFARAGRADPSGTGHGAGDFQCSVGCVTGARCTFEQLRLRLRRGRPCTRNTTFQTAKTGCESICWPVHYVGRSRNGIA